MPSSTDLPLICRCDRKPVGTLTIVHANHPAFTDAHGTQQSNLVRIDQLQITLTDAEGDAVCSLELPMERVPADS